MNKCKLKKDLAGIRNHLRRENFKCFHDTHENNKNKASLIQDCEQVFGGKKMQSELK